MDRQIPNPGIRYACFRWPVKTGAGACLAQRRKLRVATRRFPALPTAITRSVWRPDRIAAAPTRTEKRFLVVRAMMRPFSLITPATAITGARLSFALTAAPLDDPESRFWTACRGPLKRENRPSD